MAKIPTARELAEMLTGKGRSISFQTTVKDRGFDHYVKQVQYIEENKPHVKIGVQASEGHHVGEQQNRKRRMQGPIQQKTPVYVAEIAFWHEFGTRYAPERSFIRSTWDENVRKYSKLAEQLILLMYLKQQDVISSLNILGLKIESDIKRKITTLRVPPNAPSTIRRKKSSNPLIDTGQLRASIRYLVEKKGGD
jgi:hypothetical protein